MRCIRMVVLLIVGMVVFGGVTSAAYVGNLNFFLGDKALNSDWKDDSFGLDVSSQAEFGALISFGQDKWPVHIAIDLLGSTQDDTISGVKLTGSTNELDFGARKQWEKGNARPFLGGGLGWVKGELKASSGGVSISSDDSSVGGWVDAGAFWRLGQRFNLGLEGRYSKAKIKPEVSGVTADVEAGGLHLGLLLGFGWGK